MPGSILDFGVSDYEYRQWVRRYEPSSLLRLIAAAAVRFREQQNQLNSPYRKYTPWVLAGASRWRHRPVCAGCAGHLSTEVRAALSGYQDGRCATATASSRTSAQPGWPSITYCHSFFCRGDGRTATPPGLQRPELGRLGAHLVDRCRCSLLEVAGPWGLATVMMCGLGRDILYELSHDGHHAAA